MFGRSLRRPVGFCLAAIAFHVAGLLAAGPLALPAAAESRVALVIGNSAYGNFVDTYARSANGNAEARDNMNREMGAIHMRIAQRTQQQRALREQISKLKAEVAPAQAGK
jgi:hypothetical protein